MLCICAHIFSASAGNEYSDVIKYPIAAYLYISAEFYACLVVGTE